METQLTQEEYLATFEFLPVHVLQRTSFARNRAALFEADKKLDNGFHVHIIQFEDGGFLFRISPYEPGPVYVTFRFEEHLAHLNALPI